MRLGLRRTVVVVLAAAGCALAAPVTTAMSATHAVLAGARVNVVGSGPNCSSFFCYKPKLVKVASKSKVAWVNESGVTHTITRCTPAKCAGHGGGTGTDKGFGTSSLLANQQYAFTFHGRGTYVYYCAIHGYATMHGTVSVH